jgi:hypothetical protein
MRLFKQSAIAPLLLLEPVECVFETGVGAERRDSDGKIDLVVRTGTLKQPPYARHDPARAPSW